MISGYNKGSGAGIRVRRASMSALAAHMAEG